MEVGRVDSSALATAIELKVEPRPKEKVVVITGASSGIGRATAQAFTRYGAALVLAARRQKPLEQAVNECRTRGAKAITVPLDVATWMRWTDSHKRQSGRLGRSMA